MYSPSGDLNPFVQVKTIAVDFTEDRSIYKAIAIELDGIDVGILINNVGISVGFCQHFTELQDEKILDDVINWLGSFGRVRSTLLLVRALFNCVDLL